MFLFEEPIMSINRRHERLIPLGKRAARLNRCADAGSEYCPCTLAELGECIECSVLRSENHCRCDTAVSCVFLHTLWQKGEKRTSRNVSILDTKTRPDGVVLLNVRVSPLLAAELCFPGSFVFLRGDENPSFDIPLAVVRSSVENRSLTLAYKIFGPKTKRLAQCRESVLLRGPYWNGIVGREWIDNSQHRECLLVAGGMSTSVLPNIVDSLLRRGNRITVVLGLPGSMFIREFLPENEIQILEMTFPDEKESLRSLMKQIAPKLLFCGGEYPLLNLVSELSGEPDSEPDLAYTRNRRMCCGEGICGSCVETIDGVSIRTCKTVR